MKPKKTPKILRNKKSEEGQSLVELIVAMGVFVITGSALFLLIFNSYTAGSLSLEIMQADLLSQEGVEALRVIRDNSWQDLIAGQYGLDDSLGYWRLAAGPEIIDGKFTRTITIEEIGSDRRKINSKITWNPQFGKPQEINLATYLTNWQKITSYCSGVPFSCQDFSKNRCADQQGCSWHDAYCVGQCAPCSGFNKRNQCDAQQGCNWSQPLLQCSGDCVLCDSFLSWGACQRQLDCSWQNAQCAGTPISCENYNSEQDCLLQQGCGWLVP